jgi:hypothetical protein
MATGSMSGRVAVRMRPDTAAVDAPGRPSSSDIEEASASRATTEAGKPETRVRLRAFHDSVARGVTPGSSPQTQAPASPNGAQVELIDADGRELWSGRELPGEVRGEMRFGDYRILSSDIARVEVKKGRSAPEGGLISVWLKPGAKVVRP